MLRTLLVTLVALILAVLVTTILGSIIQTQFNLGFLQALDVDIPFSTRVLTTGQDLLGFAPAWAALVAATFVPAFLVAWLANYLLPVGPALLYPLAGFCGIVAAILLVNAALGLTPIAATRLLSGLVSMGLAGAVGGWVFHRCTRPWTAG